jgi:hypothetical protein
VSAKHPYAGVIHIPGVARRDVSYAGGHHMLAGFGKPLAEVSSIEWPRDFVPSDGAAHGEPFTHPVTGLPHERFGGRLYDARALDVVRAIHHRVTWAPFPIDGGDDIESAAVALFGCVDGQCVAIIAACKPEGGR